ncbi:hypothetical protein Tco_0242601 [Tanacetum coccineum]
MPKARHCVSSSSAHHIGSSSHHGDDDEDDGKPLKFKCWPKQLDVATHGSPYPLDPSSAFGGSVGGAGTIFVIL